MEDGFFAVHRLQNRGVVESLDAVVVEEATAATVVTVLLAAALGELLARPAALAAGPFGLGNIPFQLSIAAEDEGRIHLHIYIAAFEVQQCDTSGRSKSTSVPVS